MAIDNLYRQCNQFSNKVSPNLKKQVISSKLHLEHSSFSWRNAIWMVARWLVCATQASHDTGYMNREMYNDSNCLGAHHSLPLTLISRLTPVSILRYNWAFTPLAFCSRCPHSMGHFTLPDKRLNFSSFLPEASLTPPRHNSLLSSELPRHFVHTLITAQTIF